MRHKTGHVSMFEESAVGTAAAFLQRRGAARVRVERKSGAAEQLGTEEILAAMAAGQANEPLRTLFGD